MPARMDAPVFGHVLKADGPPCQLFRALLAEWSTNEAARAAFLIEIDAGARVDPGSAWLVPARGSAGPDTMWLSREFGETTLAHQLRAGLAIPFEKIVTVAATMLFGLDELASIGLVHGAPQPSNFVVCADGRLRLADCASCRLAFAGGAAAGGPLANTGDLSRFFGWFVPVVRESAAGQPDRRLREVLAGLLRCSDDAARAKVLRMVAERYQGQVFEFSERRDEPACEWTPPTFPVRIAVGPIAEERASYEASKVLSPVVKKPIPVLRAELRSGRVVARTTFPRPLDELEECLRRWGVHFEAELARGASSVSPAGSERRTDPKGDRLGLEAPISDRTAEAWESTGPQPRPTSPRSFVLDVVLFLPKLLVASVPGACLRLGRAWQAMVGGEASEGVGRAAGRVLGISSGLLLRLAVLESALLALVVLIAMKAARI